MGKNPLKTHEIHSLDVFKFYFYRLGIKNVDDYFIFCEENEFKQTLNKTHKQFAYEKKVFEKNKKENKNSKAISSLLDKKIQSNKQKRFKSSYFLENREEYDSQLNCLYNLLDSFEREIFLILLDLLSKDYKNIITNEQVISKFPKGLKNSYLYVIYLISKNKDFYINDLNNIKLKGSLDKKINKIINHLFVKFKQPKGLYSCWFTDKDSFFINVSQGASMKKNLKSNIIAFKKHLFKSFQDKTYYEALRDTQYKKVHLSLKMKQEFDKIIDFSTEDSLSIEKLKWNFIQFISKSFIDEKEIFPLWDFTKMKYENDIHFKLLGRNINNYYNEMRQWHSDLGKISNNKNYTWGQKFVDFKEKREVNGFIEEISIKELCSFNDLFYEGKKQKHCVSSYAKRCEKGLISILSLRIKYKEEESIVATIEVNHSLKRIVQARGKLNKGLDSKSKKIINRWANLNKIGDING